MLAPSMLPAFANTLETVWQVFLPRKPPVPVARQRLVVPNGTVHADKRLGNFLQLALRMYSSTSGVGSQVRKPAIATELYFRARFVEVRAYS